jgi:cellulose biosynthesis protein BcsQ
MAMKQSDEVDAGLKFLILLLQFGTSTITFFGSQCLSLLPTALSVPTMQELLTYLENHPAFVAAAGTIVGALLSAAFTWYLKDRAARRLVADIRKENGDLWREQGVLKQKVEQQTETNKALAGELAETKQRLEAQTDETGKTVMELGEKARELSTMENRLHRAYQKDGQTWIERVRANAPEFKRLDPDERRMPIISVVNLKGGVGKTTITANLAAALDAMGWRVLLLDLDLQGSLSGLFLSDADLAQRGKENRLLDDFLESSFDAEHPKLPDYVHPILSGRSGLVPASDNLFYAESNLTIRWQLRDGTRDPRFLLRKELHLKRICNNYDIVLMDCPPVFNVCCVNALAASDYVLAPILATKQSTIRVPALLKRLKEFRDNVNSDLHVMGIVANRTWRSELTSDEANRLTALADISRDTYGTTVPLFESFIRNSSSEIRAAEDEHRPLTEGDGTYRLFVELANEVASNLPNFCKPVPAERRKEVVS